MKLRIRRAVYVRDLVEATGQRMALRFVKLGIPTAANDTSFHGGDYA